MSWHEVVALADVILGMFWDGPGIEERLEILKRVNHDFRLDGLPEGSSYESRYRGLALLSLGSSDDGPTVRVPPWRSIYSSDRRDQNGNRVSRHPGVPDWNDAWNPGPHEIEPAIQARLRELLESARAG